MIFSHRQYCNICPVQRPINSIASGQDFSSFCTILQEHRRLRQQEAKWVYEFVSKTRLLLHTIQKRNLIVNKKKKLGEQLYSEPSL